MVNNKAKFLILVGVCGALYSLVAKATPVSGLNTEGFNKEKVQEEIINTNPNPFIQPVNDYSLSDMELTAIVFGDPIRAALINGNVVHEGESVGPYEVNKIEAKRVLLRNEAGLFAIDIKGSAKVAPSNAPKVGVPAK